MENRKLKIEWDRQRLHSSILGSMRCLGLPANLEGYDLIRGTAFGKIDHPEYELKDAVERAIEMTQIPSRTFTYSEAVRAMYYCIEGGYIEENEISDCDHYDVVAKIIRKICYSVRYDYYREMATEILKKDGIKVRNLRFEILLNMIVKMLFDNDSSEECLITYAYKKSFMEEPTSFEEAKEKIIQTTGINNVVKDVGDYVDKIYLM